MDGQLIAALLIVAGALCYLTRQTFRTWSGKSSCCSKGCGSKPAQTERTLISADELTLRIRTESSRHREAIG